MILPGGGQHPLPVLLCPVPSSCPQPCSLSAMTRFLAVLRDARLRSCSSLAVSSSEQPAASLHTDGSDLPPLLCHPLALRPWRMGKARSRIQEEQNWHLQLQPWRGMRDAVTPSPWLSPRAEQPVEAGR